MHYHWEGDLTARDCKRHIAHQFAAPVDSGQMEMVLRFSPERVHDKDNMLCLTVFDPDGFRGAGHRGGALHLVRLSAHAATPGYLPGPLQAGEWTAEIDTHMIMPDEPLHYWLDVTISDEMGTEIPNPVKAGPPNKSVRSPGWYRGDLHSHTNHSDAGDRTVAELLQTARDYGLDFIFLTDHNTTSGLAEVEALASGDLYTAGGVELTTYWGHALCLGARSWVDWRVRPGTGDMPRIAAETYARDQVFVIAHPQSMGDPACTGCAWRYGEMMPGNAQVVEIWNGPWSGDSNNEATLALYYDWLNQGLRLAATAGTDTHGNGDYAAGPGFSVIYAEALTETALLKAVRAGHLYLSAGPQLTLQAESEQGDHWMMGDTVTQAATFGAAWANCPPGVRVCTIVNGRLQDERSAGTQGEYAFVLTRVQADWVLVELRGAHGGLLAITNPIFLE